MITEDQLEQLAIQWFHDTGKITARIPSPRPSPTRRGRKAAEREALRTLTPALSQREKEEDGRLSAAIPKEASAIHKESLSVQIKSKGG